MTPQEYQQLLASTDGGQLPIAQPSFLQGLGQRAFPDQPGVDPAQSAAARSQALLTFGLGTLAASQQPGARFGQAVFSGFGQAAKTYGEAADNAFKSNLAKQAREDKQHAAELEQKSQARLDKEAARLDRADARKASEDTASTATRLAAGIQNAPDPLQYFGLVKNLPEVQSTLKEYGLDPEALTTPEAIQAAGAHLGQGGALGLPYQKPDPLELQAIMGPDGKPIFVPKNEATYKSPFQKSGMRVSLPDGTTISEGGPEPINPSELTKPVVTGLQDSIVTATANLQRIENTLQNYDPKFLTARGIIDANTSKIKEFVGIDLSPEKKKSLDEYTSFKSNAAAGLNENLRAFAGKAITESELKRATKDLPTGEEISHTDFESKVRRSIKNERQIIMRSNFALRNGIGAKSVDEVSKLIPLGSIEKIYEERANEIWQQLGGTKDSKTEAVKRANQEFGLAR